MVLLAASLVIKSTIFFSDLLNFGGLSIRSFGDLSLLFLGECDNKKSENESISGFDFKGSFDKRLPFSDELTKLISGHIESIERSSTESSFNIFDAKFNLS